MKEQREQNFYEPPSVEVTEVAVEQGFFVSDVDAYVDPWGDGGLIGDGEAEEY